MFDSTLIDYRAIQPLILRSLNRYGRDHTKVGSFLTACLANDFMEAACRADHENADVLPQIAKYIYNELPSQCHGSPEKVRDWLAQKPELAPSEEQSYA